MTCASCRYCMKLYVPPTNENKDVPKDSYVCTIFLNEKQIMYLKDNKGICEMYSNKWRKNDTN